MQHLDTDRLAALADESPTADEAVHLAACLPCRGERAAYVALLDLAQREGSAAHADEANARLTSWDALSVALRAEGLLQTTPRRPARSAERAPAHVYPVARFRPNAAAAWRVAASAALLLGGAAIGRASATPGALALGRGALRSRPVAEVPSGPIVETAATPVSRGPTVGLSDTLRVNGEPTATARLASRPGGGSDGMAEFAGVGDAMLLLSRSQRDYQRAAAYLAEHDSSAVSGTPQVLQARLAALDEVMPKVRQALYEAPQDPVLNQYYLTTYDVRESTLRQLGRALPVGMRLNGY